MITLLEKLSFAELRTKAGYKSQSALARHLKAHFGLEITSATISGWETGKWKPELSPKDTQILLKVLGCSLDELVEAFDSRDLPE